VPIVGGVRRTVDELNRMVHMYSQWRPERQTPEYITSEIRKFTV